MFTEVKERFLQFGYFDCAKSERLILISCLVFSTYLAPLVFLGVGVQIEKFSVFFYLAAFFSLSFFSILSVRFGAALVLISLPLHVSPALEWAAILPVKSVAAYFLLPLLFSLIFRSNFFSFLKKRGDLAPLLFFIFFTFVVGVVSILFAPEVAVGSVSIFDIHRPGTYVHAFARLMLTAAAMLSMVVIYFFAVDLNDNFFVLDALLCGWLFAVLLAAVGLAFIIFGVESGAYTFTDTYRPVSSFFSVTSAAGYIAIVFPLAVMRLHMVLSTSNWYAFFFLSIAILLAILVVVSTTSRTGLLLLLFTGLAYSICLIKDRAIGLVGVLILAVIVSSAALWTYPPEPFLEAYLTQETDPSYGQVSYVVQRLEDNNLNRLNLMNNAVSLGVEHPIIGVGFGMMQNYELLGVQVSESHSFLLDAFAETGTLGLFVYLAFVAYTIFVMFKVWHIMVPPTFLILSCYLVLFGIFVQFSLHQTFATVWAWSIIGFVLGKFNHLRLSEAADSK